MPLIRSFVMLMGTLALTTGCAAPQPQPSAPPAASPVASPVATVSSPSPDASASPAGNVLPAGLEKALFETGRTWTYTLTAPGAASGQEVWSVKSVANDVAEIQREGYVVHLPRSFKDHFGAVLGAHNLDQPVKAVIDVHETVTVPAGTFTAVHYTTEDNSLNSAWLGVEIWASAEVGLIRARITRHDLMGAPPHPNVVSQMELASYTTVEAPQ